MKLRRKTIILCLFLEVVLASKSYAAEEPRKLVNHLEVARQHANCGEWQEAIESYDKALTHSRKDAFCLARRGYAFARLGNFRQAFVDFAGAIECDTNCADAYSRRSLAYSWLGLKKFAQRDARTALTLIGTAPKDPHLLLEHAGLLYILEKSKEADEESKQVLASCAKGTDVSTLFLASTALRQLGQYQDLLSCVNRALKLSPDCADLHWLRAGSYAGLNQWSLCGADMDQVLHSSPKNPMASCGRGYCYFFQGNNAKAAACLDQAIKLEPDYALAFYWRGRTDHDLNKHQNAIDDFTAAIALDGTESSWFQERADNYWHQKKWQEALKDTHQALALDPKCWRAYLTQGAAHNELKQFTEALDDESKAVALAPKNDSVYFERGMSYRHQKQYKKAIADLTESIKRSPKNAIYFCARGSAFVSDHQYQRAISDCNQSLKLNAHRTHPHLSRGIAYSKLSQYKLALQDLDEAIRQSPDYGEAYYQRGLVYKSLGKQTLYKGDLEKAKALGYGSAEAMR